MYLFELFSQPEPYRLKREVGNEVVYHFWVDHIEYEVHALRNIIDNVDDFAEVFQIGAEREVKKAEHWFKNGGQTVTSYEFAEMGQGDDYNQSLHHTTGHAGPGSLKIFATVIAIFEKEVKPNLDRGSLVVVSAKSNESSRVKLYQKFASKYNATQINGSTDVIFVMENK